MIRDREKQENEERTLRLQQESRKQEEYLNQRMQVREDEIKELKSFQEGHMKEMKEHIREANDLRTEESRLKRRKQEIAQEFAKLDLNARERNERMQCPYNLRRIKMLLRQRSDSIRRDLKDDIDLLGRISIGCTNEQIDLIKENFEMQYDLEIQKQSQIEAMYESEAKHLLIKQEKIWNQEANGRENLLKKLIAEQIQGIDEHIAYNVQKQCELNEMKESHLKAIENANQRLKDLMADNRVDESKSIYKPRQDNSNSMLLVAEELKQSSIKDTENNVQAPRFGRKKVAWT